MASSNSSSNRPHVGWLVLLAALALFLSVDYQGLTGRRTAAPADSSGVDPAVAGFGSLSEAGRELLEREHDAVVAEIRLRVEQEHLLYSLKFVLVGGILYLLFQQAHNRRTLRFARTEFSALGSWAAVVATAMVDLRIVANQSFVSTLGAWARRLEGLALPGETAGLGWEAFLASQLIDRPWYPALRVSGQLLTALLFSVTAAMFFGQELDGRPRIDRQRSAFISALGAGVCLLLMWVAAVSLRRNPEALAVYGAVAATALALAVYLARSSSRSKSSPTPPKP
ncbi:MAG: hypothetical protein AB7L66_12680 [Gemmatimonadales bacterium]